MADLFAPPTEEEVTGVKAPATSDLFAPPTSEELQQPATPATVQETGDLFAPPSPELKRYAELTDERNSYGLGDLVRPKAIAARGGIFSTKTTPQADLEALAEGIGVDKEAAVALGPLLGAVPPLDEMTLSKGIDVAASRLNYALGNLPQFLAKKIATDDPKIRQFIDEARELAEGRMGAVEFLGENFIPISKLVQMATGAQKLGKAAYLTSRAGQVVEATAGGAAMGLGGSKEGEEISGAATGAALGGLLGGIATAIGKKRQAKDIDPVTQEISDTFFKNNEANISKVTEEAYSKVAKSTEAMAEHIVDNKQLTPEDAKFIVDEQIKPDTAELIKKKLQDDYQAARPKEERALPIPEEVTDDLAIANEVIRQRKKQFAQDIQSDVPGFRDDAAMKLDPDTIIDRARALGSDYLKDEFRRKMAIEVGEGALDRLNLKIGPGSFSTGKTLVNAVGDRQFGFIVADERTGSKTYQKFLDFMENRNLFTAEKHDWETRLNAMYASAKKAGLKKEVRSEVDTPLFRALDTEDLSGLSPEQLKVADDVRDFFDTMRWRDNTIQGRNITPLNIAKKEKFGLPHMTVDPVETNVRITNKLAEVESLIGDLQILKDTNPADFTRLSNTIPALDELRRGVDLYSDRPAQTGEQLLAAIKQVTSGGGSVAKLQTTASTVFQRKDAIPDFLREKDLFKLMSRYAESTMRNIYYRNILQGMLKEASFLDKVGAKPEAEFVRRFVADNLGIREFSMARLGNEARLAFAKSTDKVLENVITDPTKRKEVVNGLRLAPELAANLQYNIYPNVLALNPRSHLSQLTQVLFKGAPELGGVYGYETAIKSMMEVFLNWKQLGVRMEEVAEKGLEPKAFLREASESVANSAEHALLYNVPAKALRTMADAAMWSYGKLNTINIATTRVMASRMLDDVAAGNKAAFKAISKMPTSVRRMLIENKGNRAEQQRALEMYLTSVTQYQYNRAAMSELGVVAGPFFSTFTKWPLATAGDIASEIRMKGIVGGLPRVVEKYAVTWMLAAAVDVALYRIFTGEWEANPEMKEVGDRAKLILGSSGARSMAPIESVGGLLKAAGLGEQRTTDKGMFTPPVVDALFNQVLRPAFDGDTEGLAKGGMKTLSTFAPGGFLHRIMLQDLPTYVTGEKPPAPWER